MIIEAHQVIEEFIQNMRITRSVQTGFLNVPVTNMLAGIGDVVVITEATFDPFEDNENVTILNSSFTSTAYSFKNKFGILDVCVFGHTTDVMDFRDTLCAWTPVVRKNGVMVFLNSEDEEIQKVITDYVSQIDPEYFEVTNCADITFIKVK